MVPVVEVEAGSLLNACHLRQLEHHDDNMRGIDLRLIACLLPITVHIHLLDGTARSSSRTILQTWTYLVLPSRVKM